MNASDALLTRIRTDHVLAGYLEWPGDFDVTRLDPVEELRLPDGSPLEPVAGCGGGGTYYLCGTHGTEPRPVLYTDSEGRAPAIGSGPDRPELPSGALGGRRLPRTDLHRLRAPGRRGLSRARPA
ncbi:hypothetical protein [Nocardiopsis ganjiahuensis]|uniref:hypothetical protein n=1 Tax=Nocardiopsis ganjiahuensis TaxID=239984 RepID=UPI000345DE70|nr:hypothetical protein [Nocardiopsis ganjiahuensis]